MADSPVDRSTDDYKHLLYAVVTGLVQTPTTEPKMGQLAEHAVVMADKLTLALQSVATPAQPEPPKQPAPAPAPQPPKLPNPPNLPNPTEPPPPIGTGGTTNTPGGTPPSPGH